MGVLHDLSILDFFQEWFEMISSRHLECLPTFSVTQTTSIKSKVDFVKSSACLRSDTSQ